MKTVYCMIAAVASTAMLASCAKELIENPQNTDAGKVLMTFASESAPTKTQLQEDGSVFWTEGDAISIFDAAGNNNLFSISEISGASAIFSGEAVPGGQYYAVYPYRESSSISGGIITAELPATQTAVDGTFASDVNLSAAVSSGDNKLYFRNLCGLASLSVNAVPEGFTLKSVSLKGRNGELLAGQVSVDTEKMTSEVSAEGGSTSVTLSAGDMTAGTYVFTLHPAELAGGLVITFQYEEGSAEVMTDQPVSIAAGINAKLPVIESAPVPDTKLYTLSDADDLLAFAASADEYAAEDVVVLNADINMEGKEWIPFDLKCTLDGQGNSIYNVTASDWLVSNVTGTLKNIVIGSADGEVYDGKSLITMAGTGSKAGVVQNNKGVLDGVVNFAKIAAVTSGDAGTEVRIGGVSSSNYGTVKNCENHGEIEVTGTSSSMIYVAGITGWASDADVTISESANYGTITVDNDNVQGIAGIAGMNRGQNIVNCDNYGTIIVKNSEAQNSWVGGIMGYCQNHTQTEKKLSGCENHGTFDIQAPSVAGVAGIAGCIHMWSYAPVTIENCKNGSEISVTTANGWMHLGGILSNVALPGSNAGDFTNKITGCTNSGDITLGAPAGAGLSGQAKIGGIAGSASKKITIGNSANTGAVTSTKLTTCYAGGILGWTDCEELALTGNDNSGSVKLSPDKSVATQCYAGGILGSSACGNAVITDNENSAAEVSIDCDSQSSKLNLLSSVGGITGLSDDDANTMSGNINRASVLSSTVNDVWVPGGGIIGGVKGSVDMSLNINFGDVTVASAGTAGDTFCGGLVGFFNMGDTSGSAQSPVTESAELVGDKTFGKLTSTGLCGLIGNSAWGSYGSSITVTDCVVGGTISGSNVSGAGNEVTLGPDSTIAAWLFGYKDNNSTKYTESGTSYGEASGYEN